MRSLHDDQKMAALKPSSIGGMAGIRGCLSTNPVGGHHIFLTELVEDEAYGSSLLLLVWHI
jgi:hypothetical protein